MRMNLITHETEELDGDYEAPPPFVRKRALTAWHLDRVDEPNLLLAKLSKGAAAWTPDGRLVFYEKSCADIRWNPDNNRVYSTDLLFGADKDSAGIKHNLCVRDPETLEVVERTEILVPSGGTQYMVLSPDHERALVTWLEQSRWGYVVVDIDQLVQLGQHLEVPAPNLSIPQFAKSGELAVSCVSAGTQWWTDTIDDWSAPSEGGRRLIGTIYVHNLRTSEISETRVLADLPQGWIPDDPEDDDWSNFWGPEFLGEDEFIVWLPDNSFEKFQFPLAPTTVLSRTLDTSRGSSPSRA